MPPKARNGPALIQNHRIAAGKYGESSIDETPSNHPHMARLAGDSVCSALRVFLQHL
jgi:hypothetical protein